MKNKRIVIPNKKLSYEKGGSVKSLPPFIICILCFVCGDFNEYGFVETFDVIYSSLTMMHFKDKKQVILKVAALLNDGGIFCLSIDKNQSEYIDMGTRKVKIYPDTPDNIISLIDASSMNVANVFETDNAYIIVSNK